MEPAARRTGARLVGIDFCAVARAAATRNAGRSGLAARAQAARLGRPVKPGPTSKNRVL